MEQRVVGVDHAPMLTDSRQDPRVEFRGRAVGQVTA